MPKIGYKEIKANCPQCGCSRDKIEYWNCGPIVYLLCPECRLEMRECVDTPNGIDEMFATWNGELWKYKPIDHEIFHVHTNRCKHAEDISDEAYIQKAIELGAKRIVFTDHAPFPGNPFGNRMDIEELPEYIATIQGLKELYKDRIEVLCGLEVEYLPSFDDYICNLKKMEGIDLLILGQHLYELSDKPMEWSFSIEDKSQEHKGLAEAMIAGINTGYFNIVAHPDRIFRRVKVWNDECEHYAWEIGKAAARNFVPLEKNYSSMQRKNQYRDEFWKNIRKAMLIVDGIDAHSIKELEDGVKQNESW